MTPEQLHMRYAAPMRLILQEINGELGTRIEQDERSYGLPRKLSGETFYASYKLREMGDAERFRLLALNIDEQEYEMRDGERAFSANATSRIMGEIRAFWSSNMSDSERIVFIPDPGTGSALPRQP